MLWWEEPFSLHPYLPSLGNGTSQASPQWEWFTASWLSFPYPSWFYGCVSCAGVRAAPRKGSLHEHCSQSGKGRQRAELGHGHACICTGCVCALLHKAASCRVYFPDLVQQEVWAWIWRGLSCATGWRRDLQPAEDVGKCGMVALVCLRLCYLGDGLFNGLLDLQGMD